MKLRLLPLFLLLIGIINAQEPNRSLVITEARLDGLPDIHIELTNMGNSDINLSEFKFGMMNPWAPGQVMDVWNDPFVASDGTRFYMLPERILKPGESFVQTVAYDFGPRKYKNRVAGYEGNQRPKQVDIYDVADFLIHVAEPTGDMTDSVTRTERWGDIYQHVFVSWNGRDCFFIEHHFADGDSATVDQVGGVFDNNGVNFDVLGYDVAGVANATFNSLLVRKYSVKIGNPDFANARGVGLEDSEWMPVPRPAGYNSWRDLWWTVGNHGAYILDENTLESDIINVDFDGKTLTVPWGVGRLDDIMRHMVKKPGIAWNYHLNNIRADSVYRSVKTGDKLTIYVLGNELQTATFNIIVSEPTADANTVVPIAHVDIASAYRGGPIVNNTQNGILAWPRVTKHTHGTDTITGTWHGLPNALRTDSLLKYLEKPVNANWEFIWTDGIARPDLKDGDILKVTSANGSVKEYHLQVQPYGPSHNGFLSSITWPDIPEKHKSYFKVLGWKGDTIAGFNPTTYNYRMPVPADYDGIPALIAKSQNLNAKVEVKRAVSLAGTLQDRTISFNVTAEDDSVVNKYNVELVKEFDQSKLQPYHAEPFLSEYVFYDQWGNSYVEIVNPGNQPLDLSNYMIALQWNSDPPSVIQSRMNVEDWLYRYDKYVPGYKWVSEAEWAVRPGILEMDLNVNAIVQPGDVFSAGSISQTGFIRPGWTVGDNLDVQFRNHNDDFKNPWGEEVGSDPVHKHMANWFLFKILNDSIKLGLKPANDPTDFELIEAWGMVDGSNWIVGGEQVQQISNYIRKPSVYKGNPVFEGSFGTNPDDSEWTWTNRPYWQNRNAGWPWEILNIGNDLGQHFMYEPTHYKSTVTSVVYKVSEGYSLEEEIRGITTGTTVGTFLANLNKADENQSLTVKSGDSDLSMDDLLNMNDLLVVLSADSSNITQYAIEVTEEGLSSDAVLTSAIYEIDILSEPKNASLDDENAGSGVITGIEYGTQLQTVIQNINIPPGASMDVIDRNGAYISTRKLNFDTVYINVTINSDTYFDVVAENGITRIVYQLMPTSTEDDAFILSNVYMVAQPDNLVHYVPRGTNVHTFLANIIPSFNATVKIVDKMGHERTEGTVVDDDKVVVTSPNGLVTRVYHLAMLRTQYVLAPTYLAYVLSDVYAVDQVDYVIAGATSSTEVTEFYSHIRPALGASAVVVDSNGNEKTTGNLALGDGVKVTSADGQIEVLYDIQLTTVSAKLPVTTQVEIYPNPTSGTLNVRGADAGSRIQIYNSTGTIVRDLKVKNNLEVISITDQPSGMYLIVISNNNQLLGRYKAIKK